MVKHTIAMIAAEFGGNQDDTEPSVSVSAEAKDAEVLRTKLDDDDMQEIRQAMCINLVQGTASHD